MHKRQVPNELSLGQCIRALIRKRSIRRKEMHVAGQTRNVIRQDKEIHKCNTMQDC